MKAAKYWFQDALGKMFPRQFTEWHQPAPTMKAFSLNGEEVRPSALLWSLLVLLFPNPPITAAELLPRVTLWVWTRISLVVVPRLPPGQHLLGCGTQNASTPKNGSVCFNMQVPPAPHSRPRVTPRPTDLRLESRRPEIIFILRGTSDDSLALWGLGATNVA